MSLASPSFPIPANDLDLVIVGTAAGRVSAELQLYYAGPGNRFWRILHEVGLTPIELQPDNYAKLLDYGIGLTDLAKGACGADINLKPADFDRMRLRSVIKTRSPRHRPSTARPLRRVISTSRPRRSIMDDNRTRSGGRPSTFALNVAGQRALVLQAMGRFGAH